MDALQTLDPGDREVMLLPPANGPGDLARAVDVAGVAFDARRVAPGDLFCCVRGSRVDGHTFARTAIESGARALVVDHRLELDVPQLLVPDVRRSMGLLASFVYGDPSAELLVLGVTGTNGKTTTTYLLEAIGMAAGLRAAVIGTVGTRIAGKHSAGVLTTPEAPDLQRLFVEMRDQGVGLVAMEVSSHALELGRVDGTRFAAAAFLNLSHDHLDFHGSLEGYFAAKERLFEPDRTGTAAVNRDDAHGVGLADTARRRGIRVATFSVDPASGAEVLATAVHLHRDRTAFRVVAPDWGLDAPVASGLVGSFNVSNALAAATTALLAGVEPDAVVNGLESPVSVPGRFERVDRGQPFEVFVDYAHTPDALTHALGAAREIAAGRVLAVFGCGGDRDREKRPAMGRAAARAADALYVTSDNPRTEDPNAIIDQILVGLPAGTAAVVDADRRSAIERAIADARPGDVVVIAGKGHEPGQTIGTTVVPFDDRQVAAEAIESLR